MTLFLGNGRNNQEENRKIKMEGKNEELSDLNGQINDRMDLRKNESE